MMCVCFRVCVPKTKHGIFCNGIGAEGYISSEGRESSDGMNRIVQSGAA